MLSASHTVAEVTLSAVPASYFGGVSLMSVALWMALRGRSSLQHLEEPLL